VNPSVVLLAQRQLILQLSVTMEAQYAYVHRAYLWGCLRKDLLVGLTCGRRSTGGYGQFNWLESTLPWVYGACFPQRHWAAVARSGFFHRNEALDVAAAQRLAAACCTRVLARPAPGLIHRRGRSRGMRGWAPPGMRTTCDHDASLQRCPPPRSAAGGNRRAARSSCRRHSPPPAAEEAGSGGRGSCRNPDAGR